MATQTEVTWETIPGPPRDQLIDQLASLIQMHQYHTKEAVNTFEAIWFPPTQEFIEEAKRQAKGRDIERVADLDFSKYNPPLPDELPESLQYCGTGKLTVYSFAEKRAYTVPYLCGNYWCTEGEECGKVKQATWGLLMLKQFEKAVKDKEQIFFFTCGLDDWRSRVRSSLRGESAKYYAVARFLEGVKVVFTNKQIVISSRKSSRPGRPKSEHISSSRVMPEEFADRIAWALRLPEKMRKRGKDLDVRSGNGWPGFPKDDADSSLKVIATHKLPPGVPDKVLEEEREAGGDDWLTRAVKRLEELSKKTHRRPGVSF